MSKKKSAAKKSSPTPPRRRKRPSRRKPLRSSKRNPKPADRQPQAAAALHVYRYEIDDNPNNAPLIVDIPIAEGRGENPPRPAFVSFTAEMAEEEWPDQFAFRVTSLQGDGVRVMVSRIDKGCHEQSWGVRLVIHALVVDLPGA